MSPDRYDQSAVVHRRGDLAIPIGYATATGKWYLRRMVQLPCFDEAQTAGSGHSPALDYQIMRDMLRAILNTWL